MSDSPIILNTINFPSKKKNEKYDKIIIKLNQDIDNKYQSPERETLKNIYNYIIKFLIDDFIFKIKNTDGDNNNNPVYLFLNELTENTRTINNKIENINITNDNQKYRIFINIEILKNYFIKLLENLDKFFTIYGETQEPIYNKKFTIFTPLPIGMSTSIIEGENTRNLPVAVGVPLQTPTITKSSTVVQSPTLQKKSVDTEKSKSINFANKLSSLGKTPASKTKKLPKLGNTFKLATDAVTRKIKTRNKPTGISDNEDPFPSTLDRMKDKPAKNLYNKFKELNKNNTNNKTQKKNKDMVGTDKGNIRNILNKTRKLGKYSSRVSPDTITPLQELGTSARLDQAIDKFKAVKNKEAQPKVTRKLKDRISSALKTRKLGKYSSRVSPEITGIQEPAADLNKTQKNNLPVEFLNSNPLVETTEEEAPKKEEPLIAREAEVRPAPLKPTGSNSPAAIQAREKREAGKTAEAMELAKNIEETNAARETDLLAISPEVINQPNYIDDALSLPEVSDDNKRENKDDAIQRLKDNNATKIQAFERGRASRRNIEREDHKKKMAQVTAELNSATKTAEAMDADRVQREARIAERVARARAAASNQGESTSNKRAQEMAREALKDRANVSDEDLRIGGALPGEVDFGLITINYNKLKNKERLHKLIISELIKALNPEFSKFNYEFTSIDQEIVCEFNTDYMQELYDKLTNNNYNEYAGLNINNILYDIFPLEDTSKTMRERMINQMKKIDKLIDEYQTHQDPSGNNFIGEMNKILGGKDIFKIDDKGNITFYVKYEE